MVRFGLVLLLVTLLPCLGLAQTSAPPLISAPASAEVPEEKPKGEIIPRPWQADPPGRRAGRIVVESVSGVLGAALIGGTLLGASYAVEFGCNRCGDVTIPALLSAAGVVGAFAGVSLGVKVGGSLMDGQGRFLPTLGGSFLGLLAGGSIAAGLSQVHELLAVPPLILGPLAGAVLGYELSHDSARDKAAGGLSPVSLFPSVSVGPSGGVVAGLVGRF